MDAEQRQIEELVQISYQALNRESQELSKAVLKERADKVFWAKPAGYELDPDDPWRPEYRNDDRSPHSEYTGRHPYIEYDYDLPDTSAPVANPPPQPPRVYKDMPSRSHARPSPSSRASRMGYHEPRTTRTSHPEVRFTLPNADLVSDVPASTKNAQPDTNAANVIRTKEDADPVAALKKVINLRKRKVLLEAANQFATASDMMMYAIPGLEKQIKALEKQQHEEQLNRDASKTVVWIDKNNKLVVSLGDKKPFQTEVETESEDDDDDDGSEG